MNKQQLLQKLKALAQEGVGGEKENAQAKLEQLMQKYSISEEELDDSISTRVEFTYHGAREKALLTQVIFKVKGAEPKLWVYKHRRTILIAQVTKSQAVEIEFLFDFYNKLYKKEEEFFFSAFIQKHRLFGQSDKEGSVTTEEYIKMVSMMASMSDESPLKQITDRSSK